MATFESTHAHYNASLDEALNQFRALLSTASSKSWKSIPSPQGANNSSASTSSTTNPKSSTNTVPAAASSDNASASSARGHGTRISPGSRNKDHLVNGIGAVDPAHVQVHKRSIKGQAEVVRAVAEVPVLTSSSTGEALVDLESFKAVLRTAEVRSAWDKLVERAHSIETLDPATRISKTDYRLGWPASPRDTITISKTFSDDTTLIDISTSLPRTPDEPAFLRPAPPFVRSHVHLLAWCIQAIPAPSSLLSVADSSTATGAPSQRSHSGAKLRITLFWQWSLKGAVFTTHHSQLASLLAHFVEFVRDKGQRIPLVSSYGLGIELSVCTYDAGQEIHTVEYAVVAEGADDEQQPGTATRGPVGEVAYDEVQRRKERKRLERALELSIAAREGWDVCVTTKAIGGPDSAEPTWSTDAEVASFSGGVGSSSLQDGSSDTDNRAAVMMGSSATGRITLRLKHAALANPNHLVRVSISTQRLAGGKVLKVNGDIVKVQSIEPRDPSSIAKRIVEVDDAASSMTASTTTATEPTMGSPNPNNNSSSFSSLSGSGTAVPPSSSGKNSTGTISGPPATAGAIMSLLRRNYIYFTSLLQEPEAKWRNVSDSRGVTVTQLNSIDPTLTIYRAEATFVGVGVWDVFSTICTPHARMQWDKTFGEATLLEDVNELSELWHIKTKPSWPVVARDSVTLRTAYKSPSSVHIFSFSTDDENLFPSIPPVRPPTIRTQTDLYGWAIEALSPTTTQITLLDQSDPKGWSNKSWTPTQMINAVAGVGDFSIKFGGPPVVTRLLGAKATVSKYDWETGVLRSEYQKATVIPQALSLPGDDLEVAGSLGGAVSASGGTVATDTAHQAAQVQLIECEIRCDCTTWAASVDIVVDPPPLKVSCLLRHRLSSGGGLWITIEHDTALLGLDDGDRIMVTVRKGAPIAHGREKGSVTVNGAKARVDVEMLPEDEVKLLTKRKRVKASPIPLDQYSTHGPRSWQRTPSASGRNSPLPSIPSAHSSTVDDGHVGSSAVVGGHAVASTPTTAAGALANVVARSNSPSTSSPLAQAVAINADSLAQVSRTNATESTAVAAKPSVAPPGQALEALAWLQTFHAEQGPELTDPAPGWAVVSERAGGTTVRKKAIARVSETLSVYRGDRIVQGMTADEIASIVSNVGCRKAWDDRVDTAIPLATYGHGCSSFALTIKPNFPWKGRIFYVSSVNAQVRVPSASSTSSTSTVLFCASASFPSDSTFDPAQVNPSSLLEGKVLLEGWILETLDPYASSLLAIPSTRCTYVTCIDHAGSMPLALNSMLNANLAKMIGSVEALGKAKGPLPRLWTPSPCLQIEGPLSDEGDQECVWRLGGGSMVAADKASVLSTVHSVDDSTSRVLLKIGGTGLKSLTAPSGDRESLIALAPSGSIIKGELPRSASLIFAGAAGAPSLHKTASHGDLARKSSRSSLRGVPAPPSTTTATTTRSKSPDKSTAIAASSHVTQSSSGGSNGGPSIVVDASSSLDLLVAELIIDLKQFPHGYAIIATTSLIAATDPPDQPLSLESVRSLQADSVPLRATAHDAPLPSILSASLESWKRHNHLVRVLVPTSAVTHPVQDPLRDGESKDSKPVWFRRLAEKGALVEIRVVPLPAEEKPGLDGAAPTLTAAATLRNAAAPRNSTATRVTFNGERIVVASQKESKAVLARLEDEDAPLRARKITRVARKSKSSKNANAETDPSATAAAADTTLPEDFRKPLAVATRLLAPKHDSKDDDLDYPDPKSPEAVTPADEDGNPKSPLLGGRAGTSAAGSRRDTLTSETGSGTPLLGGILGAYPLGRFGTMTMPTSLPSIGGDATATLTARTFSLSFVLVVAIISFLLGSLLRSLLTPADYIIYRPYGAEGQDVERTLMNALTDRRWREARRLLELRALPGFARWDLIVALVKRD